MTPFALLLLLGLQAPAQKTTATGTIAGCVTDISGGTIPGATLVAGDEKVERTTTTDAAGCFELTGLRPGPYRVTASLPGFRNFTRRVVVTRNTAARSDMTLTVGVLCDCVLVEPPKTLEEAWNRADAAMHLRIVSGESELVSTSMYYSYDVRVLQSFRRNTRTPPVSATVSVFELLGGTPRMYASGKELVIFPTWLPQANAYLGLGTTGPDCCNSAQTVFEVEGGRISVAPQELKQYVGMRVDAFLRELRALSAAPRK